MFRKRFRDSMSVGLLAACVACDAVGASADQAYTIVSQSTASTAATGRRPIAERIKAANRPIRVASEVDLAPDEGLIRKLTQETAAGDVGATTEAPVSPAGGDLVTGSPLAQELVQEPESTMELRGDGEPAVIPPPPETAVHARPVDGLSGGESEDVAKAASLEATDVAKPAESNAEPAVSQRHAGAVGASARTKPAGGSVKSQSRALERLQARLSRLPRPMAFLTAPRPAVARSAQHRGSGQSVSRSGTSLETIARRDSERAGQSPSETGDGGALSGVPSVESDSPAVVVADVGGDGSQEVGDGAESSPTAPQGDVAAVDVPATTEVEASPTPVANPLITDPITIDVATVPAATALPEVTATRPVVECQVTGPEGAMNPGDRAELKVVVRNVGTSQADNVAITLFFADGLEPVGVAGRSADIFEGQIRFAPLRRLPPGGEMRLKVATVTRGLGTFAYRAHVSHQADRMPVLADGAVCAIPPSAPTLADVAAPAETLATPEAVAVAANANDVAEAVPAPIAADANDVAEAVPAPIAADAKAVTETTGTPSAETEVVEGQVAMDDSARAEDSPVVEEPVDAPQVATQEETTLDVVVEGPDGGVERGEKFELRFTIRNTGGAAVKTVFPMMHFGHGVEPISFAGGEAEVTADGSVIFKRHPGLAPGEAIDYVVVAACREVGSVPFQAVVVCGDGESPETVPVDGVLEVIAPLVARGAEGPVTR